MNREQPRLVMTLTPVRARLRRSVARFHDPWFRLVAWVERHDWDEGAPRDSLREALRSMNVRALDALPVVERRASAGHATISSDLPSQLPLPLPFQRLQRSQRLQRPPLQSHCAQPCVSRRAGG